MLEPAAPLLLPLFAPLLPVPLGAGDSGAPLAPFCSLPFEGDAGGVLPFVFVEPVALEPGAGVTAPG